MQTTPMAAGLALSDRTHPADTRIVLPALQVDTTIVVPTFNEGANVPELVARLTEACRGRNTEVLFVDDSTDGTPNVIEAVARHSVLPVRLIHRLVEDRVGGLSGAVAVGLQAAQGRYVVVMDGDLQHPPELVPTLRDSLGIDGTQVAVASRYTGAGDNAGLSSGWRRLVSNGSTVLARGLFPHRVGRRCTDPMTGFFSIDRHAIGFDRLRPRGFKILLEILARHPVKVSEVPFVFGERNAGESKANWRQGAQFIYQLLQLRLGNPMVKFGSVGAVGFVLNLVLMGALLAVDINYLIASIVASEVTIVTNFLMQEKYVFANQHHARTWRTRLAHHLGLNNAELLLRLPVLALLVEGLGIPEVPAQAVLLVVGFLARFFILSRVTYRSVPQQSATPAGVEELEAKAA